MHKIVAKSEEFFLVSEVKVKFQKLQHSYVHYCFNYMTVICACLLAFRCYIVCFSSFINSRVTGITVAVSMRIGSKFSDLPVYLQLYLT